MANPFVHVELNTQDVAQGEVVLPVVVRLDAERGRYGRRDDLHADQCGRGNRRRDDEAPDAGAPSMWLPYVLVDDIVAATAKAKSLGATVVRDVMEVMGAGSLSVIIDPTGAALGLWQAKAK